MCYLLTIGTRESAENVKALLGHESPLTISPAINPSLKAVFPAGDRLFHVIVGQCSCDLVVPAKTDKEGGPQDAFWSWLRQLVVARGGVRLFVHWYSGAFDTERVTSGDRIRVPVDRLVDASVFGQDRLVDVVPPERRPYPSTSSSSG
jgi:hypothetical protein